MGETINLDPKSDINTTSIIDVTTDKIKETANSIEKLEYKDLVLYEKGTPFYNSKVLGIPLKYIIGGIAFISIIRSK